MYKLCCFNLPQFIKELLRLILVFVCYSPQAPPPYGMNPPPQAAPTGK